MFRPKDKHGEKSSAFFSRNATPQLTETICSLLDGIQVQFQSKYLGPPLVIGRSKSQVFKYVVEAVDGKISSWRNKMLSFAGRETLLKSVAMALPNYTMSCFKLSNIVCKQIERKLADHWWGGDEDKGKIHWKRWETLTTSKEEGGLNFRNLQAVNEAFLAKQVWKIIQEPILLVSQVLKQHYVLNQDFFLTQLKGRDSWLWKSWLGAKDVVEKGMRWSVGDGKQIHIWTDKWLSDSFTGKISSPRPTRCSLMYVSELTDQAVGDWNHQLVL